MEPGLTHTRVSDKNFSPARLVLRMHVRNQVPQLPPNGAEAVQRAELERRIRTDKGTLQGVGTEVRGLVPVQTWSTVPRRRSI